MVTFDIIFLAFRNQNIAQLLYCPRTFRPLDYPLEGSEHLTLFYGHPVFCVSPLYWSLLELQVFLLKISDIPLISLVQTSCHNFFILFFF